MLTALLFLPAASVHANALDDTELTELFQFVLEEKLGVVNVASAKQQKALLAPATVTVLNEDDIRHSAARSIPDLLRSIPGMQVVQIAPGNYSVSIRGMAGLQSNNLVVLLDHIPINNPIDGSLNWATLPVHLNDVVRVEVARGPISPIYGADAFTGAVLIQTRSGPAAERAPEVAIQLGGGIDYQGHPAVDLHGGFDGRKGPLAWYLTLWGSFDDTFTNSGSEAHAGLRKAGLYSRVAWRLLQNTSLELTGGGACAESSAVDGLVVEPFPHQSCLVQGDLTLRVQQLANWLPSVKAWSRGQFLIRWADEEDFSQFHYDGTQGGFGRAGFEVDFLLPWRVEMELGFEASVFGARGEFIHPDERGTARWTYAPRVHASVDIADRLVVEAGLRGDISAFIPDPQLSARGSLIYHQEAFSLRLSVATAYRNPTYVEAGSRFVDQNTGLILLEGAGDLKPPRLNSIELGSIFGLFGDELIVRPTVYLSRANDLIIGDFESISRRTYQNDFRDVDILGGELELEWQTMRQLTTYLQGSLLTFLSEQPNPSASVGISSHNSAATIRLGARGRLLENSLTLAGSTSLASGREWNTWAGIPPLLLPKREIPLLLRVELSADWRPWSAVPLWLQLQAVSHLPHGTNETAYEVGAQLGTSAFLSCRYRIR